ncbi:MAG TPA: class I SAM-dependent methyltransferase [Rhizomicrobium sp.]|nr:class I SAM-dependent methyltransferase [Rhizomicrobium sp.]
MEARPGTPSLDNVASSGSAVRTELAQWGRFDTADRAQHGNRYAEWTAALRKADLLPLERLLPTVTVPDCGALPPAMGLAQSRPLDPALLAQIRTHQWGYWFDLGHGQSTLGAIAGETGIQRTARQRMLYRMNAIDGAIAALYGGALAGTRVLDLACNHGAFSLDLLARGAARARGVDLRPENIEKAGLLRRHLGVNAAEFVQGDIYAEAGRRYDIVLCLGLMYHVTRPWELVELCYQLCTGIAVIDTITHREPFSGFLLGFGQLIPLEHAAGAINAELHPTYRGLIDLMRGVGFREVIEVEGVPDPSWVNWEKDVYAVKLRRCLIGLK